MNPSETYDQLNTDLKKTLFALLNVRTTREIQAARQLVGYTYNGNNETREFWIALGQYSFITSLSYLSFVINAVEQIVPTHLQSKSDIVNYVELFDTNKDKVIAAFDRIIGKPNQLFIGYTQPITMEEYLKKIVSDIHSEALNLEYNYQKLIESK